MLKLSLDNQLIGEYESIYALLGMKTENTKEYRAIRDEMTSEANRLITIVSGY